VKDRIVVFANSHKHGQHCVAGKRERDHSWVRPVSSPDGAELSHDQVQYRNPYGTFSVKPLQIIEMEFSQLVPLPNQPENRLITDFTWQQRFNIGLNQIDPYLDAPANLWGHGDRVPFSSILSGAFPITQSLYLVRVENLNLNKRDNGKRRALFTYQDADYDLAVTDPKFDHLLGRDSTLSGVICVSLGEEYEGNCFKLVATLFHEPDVL